jgi:hypothetical protein
MSEIILTEIILSETRETSENFLPITLIACCIA